MFLQMLATKAASDPLNVLLMTVEDHISFTVRLGWLYNNGQWRQCEANRHFSEPLMAGLFVAENVFFLKGVYGMRFGTGVQSLAAISCDDTFVVWWETGRSGDWRHCFMPGTSHLNVERLTENNASRISIIQFLITDDPRFATPRKVLDIDEATASSNSTSRTKGFGRGTPSKIKMILDGDANGHQEGGTVSHEQAASGSGSSSAKIVSAPGTPRSHAADSDVTVESQPVREGHGFIDDNDVKQEYEDEDWELEGIRRRSRDLQMSFVSRAPDAGQHVSGGNSYVLEEDKIDADQPELVLPNHYLSYITSTEKFKKPRQMRQDEELVFRCGKGRQWFAVIERVNNVLTREEALQEVDSCRESMIQELARWHKHGAWRRIPRSRCNNLLTSKWVLKWKDVAGKRAIKARMVAQGFKDAQQTCNYSATTSRWAQRLVIIMAVQFKWRLVSADVSEAFLRGLTFKELFEGGTGREMRNVQLALPAGCDELIRTIPGMEDFDSQVEGLELLKPGFGLKDAPRMWSLALSRVLAAAGVLPTRVDPQLYVKHNALGELLILLSVHVDDLKITGRHDEVDALLALLNKEFDQLKLEVDNFTHLGIKHKLLDDGSREVSQDHYVAELRPIPEDAVKTMGEDALVNEQLGGSYRSLLGGIAWTVQTRPDVAAYVASLQRKLQDPRARDIINLNRVLRYIKAKPLSMRIRRLESPWSLVAVSDSAYKSDGVDCLTMRSGLILLMNKSGIQVGTNHCQLVDFVAKKQTRVCRSTYIAELFSLLDLLGHALNINLTLTEVLGGRQKLEALEQIHEQGMNALQLMAAIDAKSVQDSVASVEVKTPTDASALIHVLRLREMLEKQITSLAWLDTRDMVADGLNKGTIDREALRQAAQGIWRVTHQPKMISRAVQRPT